MFNAYEKAHKACDWLSMSDVSVCMCGRAWAVLITRGLRSQGDKSKIKQRLYGQKVVLSRLELLTVVVKERGAGTMNYIEEGWREKWGKGGNIDCYCPLLLPVCSWFDFGQDFDLGKSKLFVNERLLKLKNRSKIKSLKKNLGLRVSAYVNLRVYVCPSNPASALTGRPQSDHHGNL